MKQKEWLGQSRDPKAASIYLLKYVMFEFIGDSVPHLLPTGQLSSSNKTFCTQQQSWRAENAISVHFLNLYQRSRELMNSEESSVN